MTASYLSLVGAAYLFTAIFCALHARPRTHKFDRPARPRMHELTFTFDRHRFCELGLAAIYFAADAMHGLSTQGVA